ncbi:hypothetical protein OY671_011617, partial [Metschnikowia pulcherrima]
ESIGDARMTTSSFWSMAYMIVAVSIGGYYSWFMISGRASATAASASHFSMPPSGSSFGWSVSREQVTWSDSSGIVPIAFGIWSATRRAP